MTNKSTHSAFGSSYAYSSGSVREETGASGPENTTTDLSKSGVRRAPTPPPVEQVDFRSSFDAHTPFVLRVLRRLGVPRADRDDLHQEIFFIVHRKLHEYDGRASFRAWLYGICVRTVSTYRRSARVRRQEAREYGDLEMRESHVALNPEHNAETRRACAEIEALLGRLDDEKRTVFVLYELEELSMTQVAEIVGCPLQTAYSRLHAARKAMKTLVQRSRLGEGAQVNAHRSPFPSWAETDE